MAKNPQKTSDPTSDALAAIEDALRVRDQNSVPPVLPPENRRVAPGPAEDLFEDTDATPTMPWSGEEGVRRPANDDREAIGAIIQSLQRRPPRTPYLIASAVSALWIVGALAFAFVFKTKIVELAAAPDLGVAFVTAAVAAVLVPVAVFFTLAHTIRRTQELRLVAQTMAEVAMRLAEPETAARDAIVNVGQAIRREVTAMGDGVERALARAAELEALVHNEVSALERAYNDNEVRIRDLLGELSSQRETLVGQAEQVRNAISGVHLGLQQDINSVGDLISERVSDVAQRVTRSLTEKGEHITLALGHAGDAMIEALSERSSTLLGRLENTSSSATSAISSATEKLSDSLTVKTDIIQQEYVALSAQLQQMMTRRLDEVSQEFAQKTASIIEAMSSRSQQMTETVSDTGARVSEQLASRAEAINTALRNTGDSLVRDLDVRGNDVVARVEQTGARTADAIIARSNTIANTFSEQAAMLTAALAHNGNAVSEMLATRLRAFDETFNRNGTELSEKISRESTTLGNLIIRHVTEFDRTLKTYGNELVERLGQRTQDVAEAMRSYVDGFDQRVTTRADEVSGTLDQRLTQFEQLMGGKIADLSQTLVNGGKDVVAALDQRITEAGETISRRGDDVAEKIAAKAAEIDGTLGTRAGEVAEHLDTRIGRFEELLVGRAEAVTSELETRTRAAGDALQERLEHLSQAIVGNTTRAEQSLNVLTASTAEAIRVSTGQAERTLTSLSDNVGTSLKRNAEDVEHTLTGLSNQVADNFVSKANEITETVTRQTNEMTTILSDRTGGVLAAIVEKGQQFSDGLARATELAVNTIEHKGLAFTQSMMSNSEEIARLINSAGEVASGTVNRTLNELQTVASQAIEQSKQTASASVSEMLETHNMLRSDSTALYERLREANLLLQEVLSGAHENMSSLENTMMLRVSDFVGAMKEVTDGTQNASLQVQQTLDQFRDNTTRMVKDLGSLTLQFGQHGRELNQAIEALDRSNMRTEDAVNERRVTLDSLISTLDIRTDDLDQRLKRFAGLLDESLESAGARAREIARVVSESSVESAHVIADQFERMRATAEGEREQTVEAMRAVYEQATGESDSLLRQAADRFADLMQSMKAMAAEMQGELDRTREELRRGILELPQETAESAMQMRRVLVDQIEALAELNRIVARHGRSLEQSEASPRRVPRDDALASPSRAETTRAAARPAVTTFAPPSRGRVAPASPAASEASAQVTKGWLTELLSRASREQEDGRQDDETARPATPPPMTVRADERIPRHTIESLDSLSVDIARMIDHDAAVDLWDRYKRGERNVFTRRLYTLQGQKAFDEIRAKYRGDREFRQTVDRYIGEFERLLEDVSRDDRGQVVARTYLTSETGKVYTMLAHASGRFDQG
ncbi:MAG: Kinesin-like protein [Pseudolabrys sp.]|jgi:ABC-type transporter Mla subunit MlaD|nr:Kinesin-like protein [Pseudolabrys sp.]